jgi:hypothetical protein
MQGKANGQFHRRNAKSIQFNHYSEFGNMPTKRQWRRILMYNRELDKYLDPMYIIAQAMQEVTIRQRVGYWVKRQWRKII